MYVCYLPNPRSILENTARDLNGMERRPLDRVPFIKTEGNIFPVWTEKVWRLRPGLGGELFMCRMH